MLAVSSVDEQSDGHEDACAAQDGLLRSEAAETLGQEDAQRSLCARDEQAGAVPLGAGPAALSVLVRTAPTQREQVAPSRWQNRYHLLEAVLFQRAAKRMAFAVSVFF